MDNDGMEYGNEDITTCYCEVCGKDLANEEHYYLYQSVYCEECYDKEKQQDDEGI